MTKLLISLGAAVLALATALPAVAQQAQQPAQQQAPPPLPGTPERLRGTIDSVDAKTLVLNSRDGRKISIALRDDLRVAYNTQKTLADLAAGSQVGVTTIDGPDGKPEALEVHMMENSGNLHGPWDLQPNSTMTNGIVTAAADQNGARMITVHYKTKDAEGDWIVTVKPDTPVVFLTQGGDRSLLVPGATVFVSARKLDDGSYMTTYIQAEKDGVKPPL